MSSNATTPSTRTGVNPYKQATFENYITYRALGGLLTDDDGKLSRMTQSEFCETYGVDKMTIWRWKTQIPDLTQRIEQRRNEITPSSRISAMFNQLYILGMQTQDKRAAVEALKTSLGHFGNLQLPVQRQDIKIQGGLAEVLAAAATDGIIEGEIVEPANIDIGTSGQDPSALPNPS